MPLLSVVITADRNKGAALAETLSTLRAQPTDAWEALVAGTGGQTPEGCDQPPHDARDSRIRVLHERFPTLNAARNAACEAAAHPWILMLRAGDWLPARIFLRLSEVLENAASTDVLHWGWIAVNNHAASPARSGPSEAELFPHLSRSCPFLIEACLIRRSTLLEASAFDPEIDVHAGWDLLQRLARAGRRFRKVHDVLVVSRSADHAQTSTASLEAVREGLRIISRGHREDPRVSDPLPSLKSGMPKADEAQAMYTFVSWCAADLISNRGRGAELVEALPAKVPPDLDGRVLAQSLLHAFPQEVGRAHETTGDEWEFRSREVTRLLEALEERSAVHGLTLEVHRRLSALLLRREISRAPRLPGSSQVVRLDLGMAVRDVKVNQKTDRLWVQGEVSGQTVVLVEMPVFGEVVPGITITKALEDEVARSPYLRTLLECGFNEEMALGKLTAEQPGEPAREVLNFMTEVVETLPPTGETASSQGRVDEQDPPCTENPSCAAQDRFGKSHFEAVFASEDPWSYSNPYEVTKYIRTLSLLNGIRPRRALELGCAEGHFTERLAPLVDHLIASDISEAAIKRATRRCSGLENVDFLQVDIRSDSLPSHFDLVVCSEVLYYLPDRTSLDEVVGKLVRHLEPGGWLLMANANCVADEPHKTGFEWGLPFGGKTVRDAVAAVPAMKLTNEIRTPLYSIQLFQNCDQPTTNPKSANIEELPVADELEPEISRAVVWGGYEVHPKEAYERESVQQLPILMYHRIARDGPPSLSRYRVSPERFEEQLKNLRRHGYRGATVEEWLACIREHRPIPGRPVLLTFDDAYEDFFTEAWPILACFGFGAIVFVVTEAVGGSATWDKYHGDPAPLMSWRQIRELQEQGVVFGSHTASHRRLGRLRTEQVIREGLTSRRTLEDHLGCPIVSVSYPHCDDDGATRQIMATCGYSAGFTGGERRSHIGDHPLALPRIEIQQTMSVDRFCSTVGITGPEAQKPAEAHAPPTSPPGTGRLVLHFQVGDLPDLLKDPAANPFIGNLAKHGQRCEPAVTEEVGRSAPVINADDETDCPTLPEPVPLIDHERAEILTQAAGQEHKRARFIAYPIHPETNGVMIEEFVSSINQSTGFASVYLQSHHKSAARDNHRPNRNDVQQSSVDSAISRMLSAANRSFASVHCLLTDGGLWKGSRPPPEENSLVLCGEGAAAFLQGSEITHGLLRTTVGALGGQAFHGPADGNPEGKGAEAPGHQVAASRRARPAVSVIVPTFNRHAMLARLLESLAAQSVPTDLFEVVTVNDGSTDDTEAVIQTWADSSSLNFYALSQTNSGAASARNRGVREASGDIILFLDDDLVAATNMIEEHLAFHERWPAVGDGCLGLMNWWQSSDKNALMHYLASTGGQYIDWRYVAARDPDHIGWHAFWTGHLSLKRRLLLNHGCFDALAFNKKMGEDLDLGKRLESAGFRLHFHPKANAHFQKNISFADLADRQRRKGMFQHHLRERGIADWTMQGSEEGGLYSRRALADVVAAVEEYSSYDPPPEVLHPVYSQALHFAMLVGAAEYEEALREHTDGVVALLYQLANVLDGMRRVWADKDGQINCAGSAWREKDQQLAHADQAWQEKDQQIAAATEMWHAKDLQLAELAELLRKYELQLADADRAWKDKDQQIAAATEMWHEKDLQVTEAAERLQAYEHQLAETAERRKAYELQLAEADRMWQDKDLQLAKTAETLREKDVQLAEATRTAQETAKELDELSRRLTETDCELRYVKNSQSWRRTAILRSCINRLKRGR